MTLSRGLGILGLIAVISIAGNLFLAGSLLGRQFHRPPPSVPFEQRLDAGWQSVWQQLPDADQPIVKEIFAQHRDDLIQKWRASRMSAQRAGKALRADPFDAAETHADFEKSNERQTEFRTAVQDMFTEIAGKISAEGREKLHSPVGGL